ncbi:MAG: hypothetical protein AAGI49_04930 [Bacteroidota bacterium]
MKNYLLTLLLFLGITTIMQAQSNDSALPYEQIPTAPDTYNACTMAARMIDGLGFRYYWATEGLRANDLGFRPNETARTMAETLDHIHGLCRVVSNAVEQLPNERTATSTPLSFEEQRAETLHMLKEASDLLRASDPKDIETFNIVFKRGDDESAFPFWNLINGPLADAIWHVGQVVSFRRSAGNPMDARVSVFHGVLKKG